MRCFMCVALLIAGITMTSGKTALGQEAPLLVEIDTKDVICNRFLGFGAEWDSSSYTKAGITEEDFSVIRERVEWMGLPVARIMMQTKWCYRGNGIYDWNNPDMKALYRHLDTCRSIGTTVFLTDWGCEPEWLQCPDVAKVNDPKYAEIIGTYMDHLVNRKGYTCIKYFIMVNEPNYEVKEWSRWKKGVENVFAEFQKRGLQKKVIFTGSDHSNNDNWHTMAVDQLQNILGAYDIHRYANDSDVRTGKLYDYFKKSWQYALSKDARAAFKPFVVGEAGMNDGAQHPRGNLNIDTIYYGIFMADYAVQAVNAGSAAVLAWMLDDNSHLGFFWGLWTNKEKGMKLRPWFYPWSLLCRSFPPGSRIIRTNPISKDVRVLAAYCDHKDVSGIQSWSFCLVNRANRATTVRLHVPAGPYLIMRRYVYSKTSIKTDANGFPAPLDNRGYDLNKGADVPCEANSVVILTSIEAAHTAN